MMDPQIIGDHEDITGRIVGFDVGKQSDVVGRVARSSTSGGSLPSRTRSAIHPGLLRPATASPALL